MTNGHKKTPLKGGIVPGTGIEPAHPCERQILSLLRLPIPPPGLAKFSLLKVICLIRT